jgi:hypothetical protein
MHLACRAPTTAPRCLVDQHAVRGRDEEIHGRGLIRGLTKAEGGDGLSWGLVHGAGLGDGGEGSRAREDGLIQVPIKNNSAITKPDGKELEAGREGNRSNLIDKNHIGT